MIFIKGGKVELHPSLNICDCGKAPILTWYYIQGIANRINYIVKCDNCGKRTDNRKIIDGAINAWNIKEYKNNKTKSIN